VHLAIWLSPIGYRDLAIGLLVGLARHRLSKHRSGYRELDRAIEDRVSGYSAIWVRRTERPNSNVFRRRTCSDGPITGSLNHPIRITR